MNTHERLNKTLEAKILKAGYSPRVAEDVCAAITTGTVAQRYYRNADTLTIYRLNAWYWERVCSAEVAA